MSNNKTVIITGAANGIGRFTAEFLLKQQQYNVVVVDRDQEALKSVEDQFKELQIDSSKYLTVVCDVSNEDQVKNMIQQSLEKFTSLFALVNNAAISNPYNDPLEDLSFDAWQRVMNVNVNSLFLTCKYAIPHLKETKGTIINISSTRSIMSEPNSEAYSTSKGGVLAFTHSLANSIGPRYGIRVNSISPGWIDTTTDGSSLREIDHRQHLTNRVGKSVDIAKMIKYFIDDENGFLTGQNIVIDGGMTVKMIYQE